MWPLVRWLFVYAAFSQTAFVYAAFSQTAFVDAAFSQMAFKYAAFSQMAFLTVANMQRNPFEFLERLNIQYKIGFVLSTKVLT